MNLGETLWEANLELLKCMFYDIPSDPIDGDDGDNFPVECTLPWDKSSLAVEGWCENDRFIFQQLNTYEFETGIGIAPSLWVTVDGLVNAQTYSY